MKYANATFVSENPIDTIEYRNDYLQFLCDFFNIKGYGEIDENGNIIGTVGDYPFYFTFEISPITINTLSVKVSWDFYDIHELDIFTIDLSRLYVDIYFTGHTCCFMDKIYATDYSYRDLDEYDEDGYIISEKVFFFHEVIPDYETKMLIGRDLKTNEIINYTIDKFDPDIIANDLYGNFLNFDYGEELSWGSIGTIGIIAIDKILYTIGQPFIFQTGETFVCIAIQGNTSYLLNITDGGESAE